MCNVNYVHVTIPLGQVSTNVVHALFETSQRAEILRRNTTNARLEAPLIQQ